MLSGEFEHAKDHTHHLCPILGRCREYVAGGDRDAGTSESPHGSSIQGASWLRMAQTGYEKESEREVSCKPQPQWKLHAQRCEDDECRRIAGYGGAVRPIWNV